MAIQLKRCTTEERLASTVVLANGQPLYDTDTKELFISDGITSVKELKGTHIGLNIKNGIQEGSLRQLVFNNDAKNPVATGIGSIALGGQRYDKTEADLVDDPVTQAIGNQSIAGGGSSIAQGDWSVAIGKNTAAYMGGSVAFNAARAGMIKEEFLEKYPDGVDSSGRPWETGDNSKHANSFAFAVNAGVARGWESFAGGTSETGIHADMSFAFGNGSIAQGDSSVALNRSRAVGTTSFASGLNFDNEGIKYGAFGNRSAVFNCNNSAEGENSSVFGYLNKTTQSAKNSVCFGTNNINNSENSLICGRYSTGAADLLFAVGGGDSNTTKDILFATPTRVAVSIKPKSGWDVVRYGDLITGEDNSNYTLIVAKFESLNTIGGSITSGWNVTAANNVVAQNNLIVQRDGEIKGTLSVAGEPTKNGDVLRWQEKVGLENKIDAEIADRTSACTQLNTKIETETSRATTRETEIDNKIDDIVNALNYSSTGSTTKTITSLSQNDGKVSATFSDIKLDSSDVSFRDISTQDMFTLLQLPYVHEAETTSKDSYETFNSMSWNDVSYIVASNLIVNYYTMRESKTTILSGIVRVSSSMGGYSITCLNGKSIYADPYAPDGNSGKPTATYGQCKIYLA